MKTASPVRLKTETVLSNTEEENRPPVRVTRMKKLSGMHTSKNQLKQNDRKTNHTMTLMGGQLEREKIVRLTSELKSPKRGIFGTPCKLEYCRAFVHPWQTCGHEKWLRKAETQSRKERNQFRELAQRNIQKPNRKRTWGDPLRQEPISQKVR